MRKKTYNCDANVICPFYKSETKLRILCAENPEKYNRSGGSVTYGASFERWEEKKNYKKKYCKGFDFCKCPLAEAFLAKI